MDIESLIRFYAFLAVAGFASAGGFAFLWIRRRERIRELEEALELQAGSATPIPVHDAGLERQLLETMDSVQAQLAELAERQDFTERLLTRGQRGVGREEATPVPTPV